MTGRYVAVDWAEAVRLAQLDGTAVGDIKCQQDIELLHRTDWWAIWSDGRLTTAIGLPEDLCPEGLSVDAIALIDEVWMGGAIAPQCGWALLAKVERIVACERVGVSCGEETSASQEKLTLQFNDNQEGTLYRCYVRKSNDYECDIVTALSD
ncbi:MAG: hypothetical protein AAFN40_16955 [Cyanobacteria bacterium J06560_6]